MGSHRLSISHIIPWVYSEVRDIFLFHRWGNEILIMSEVLWHVFFFLFPTEVQFCCLWWAGWCFRLVHGSRVPVYSGGLQVCGVYLQVCQLFSLVAQFTCKHVHLDWIEMTKAAMCYYNQLQPLWPICHRDSWLQIPLPPISFHLSSCRCLILSWLCLHDLPHLPNDLPKTCVSGAFRFTEGLRRWRVEHCLVARPPPSPRLLASLVFRNGLLWDSIMRPAFSICIVYLASVRRDVFLYTN